MHAPIILSTSKNDIFKKKTAGQEIAQIKSYDILLYFDDVCHISYISLYWSKKQDFWLSFPSNIPNICHASRTVITEYIEIFSPNICHVKLSSLSA